MNNTDYQDIKYILLTIKNNFKTCLKIIFTILFFSILYSLISEEYYKSEISLYAAGELSDDNDFVSNLVSQSMGIGDLNSPSYYIPDIVSSRSLKESIVLNQWVINNNKINLIEFWEINSIGFLDRFFNKKDEKLDQIYLNNAVEMLDDLIVISESSSGLITVSVYNQNSDLASDIANYISEYVVRFVTDEQRKFASQNRTFIESQLTLSKNDLSNSEEKLTKFRKAHPISLDNPDLQLQRARLFRDIEVNQEVYITLRKQYEISKIEESKVRLLVNVLDEAIPSINPDHPKIVLISILGIFIGLIISIFYLFSLEIINKRKA